MAETTIKWRNAKRLSALAPDVAAFFREVAPDISEKIEQRSKRQRLPSGSATAPLTKGSQKRKAWDGKQPVRNFDWSGQMWRGKIATVSAKGGTPKNPATKVGLRIAFQGPHVGKKGQKVSVVRRRKKDKEGNTIESRQTKTNQMVANAAARVDAAGRRLPEGIAKVPFHNFMDLSKSEWRELPKKFDKHVVKAWRNLPPAQS